MKPICAQFCVALALLLPFAAAALEEPDAIYGRFHRAVIAEDVNEMLKYSPDQQKAELNAMSPGQRSAQVKMIASLFPRSYVLKAKEVNPDGKGALLLLFGAGPVMLDSKPETLWGRIRMVVERGDWKVQEVAWSNSTPAAQAPPSMVPRPGPAAVPQKAATPAPATQKAVAPANKAPVVGAMGGAPERKLGVQKPPCVFKPVMTAEDVENCR